MSAIFSVHIWRYFQGKKYPDTPYLMLVNLACNLFWITDHKLRFNDRICAVHPA